MEYAAFLLLGVMVGFMLGLTATPRKKVVNSATPQGTWEKMQNMADSATFIRTNETAPINIPIGAVRTRDDGSVGDGDPEWEFTLDDH